MRGWIRRVWETDPRRDPNPRDLSEADLVAGIRAMGRPAHFEPTVDGLVARLTSDLRSGDVVAILSNGAFGGLHDRLLTALQDRLAREGRL